MVNLLLNVFTNREFELSSPDVEQVIEVNPVDGQVHLRTSFAYRYPSAKDSSLGVSGSRYDTGRKIFENLLNSNQPTITMTVTEGEKKKDHHRFGKTSVLRAKSSIYKSSFKNLSHGIQKSNKSLKKATIVFIIERLVESMMVAI